MSKYFGLISVLLVIAGAVWFLSNGLDRMGMLPPAGSEKVKESGVNSVIDSARTAADQLGNSALNGKKIEIYSGISFPEDTTKIDLSDKGLNGSLKAEVRMFTELKELNINGNNFTGLPAEVGQLSKLEVLNLSDNPFTGLPHELGNLKNLKVLNLKGTQYSTQDLDVIKSGLPSDVQIITN